jgi:thiamine biosynthesis lipoprotein ApbE
MVRMLPCLARRCGLLLAAALAAPPAPLVPPAKIPPPTQVPAPAQAPAPAPAVAPAPPAATTPPAAPGQVHPLRATTPACGATLEIEVRDLPREAADAAIQAAAAEVLELERMTDPGRLDGELGALNAAAGKGPRRLDPRLFAALTRTLDFCLWSEGKQGPLARDLHRLWGRGAEAPLAESPSPELLRQATAAAACQHLALDPRRQTAALDAGSAIDLIDFNAGMAVDRVIEVLRQHGSANAFAQLGAVRRGIGGGRDGRGWMIDLPAMGGLPEPLGRVFLRNQALAMVSRDDHPLRVAGQLLPPFLDQRSGQPATEGVFATLAVAELALDAQALAATLAITGTREGELLMGSIRPRPSILWLMGSGTGIPLLVPYRWTEVPRR